MTTPSSPTGPSTNVPQSRLRPWLLQPAGFGTQPGSFITDEDKSGFYRANRTFTERFFSVP